LRTGPGFAELEVFRMERCSILWFLRAIAHPPGNLGRCLDPASANDATGPRGTQ